MKYALSTVGNREIGRAVYVKPTCVGYHVFNNQREHSHLWKTSGIRIKAYRYIVWQILFMLSAAKLVAQPAPVITTLSADVTRISHNVLLTEEATSTGHFYYQSPDKICMTFNEYEDMLLMNGTTYTMIENGKKNVAKGKMQELFGVLQKVLQAVINQSPLPDMTETPDIQVKQEGQTIQIIPILDAKTRRRSPFTSFTITFEAPYKLKTIRINEKGENYVLYNLSGHVQNGSIDNAIFRLD